MNFKPSNKVHFVALAEYKTSPTVRVNGDGSMTVSNSSVTATFDADVIGAVNHEAIVSAQNKYLEMNPEYEKCLILSWQRYEEEEAYGRSE